jgi:hypothetical protein
VVHLSFLLMASLLCGREKIAPILSTLRRFISLVNCIGMKAPLLYLNASNRGKKLKNFGLN